MYIVYYEGTEYRGRAFYSNSEHIPKGNLPFIEITEGLYRSPYPIEIYKENGKKKARVDEAKKIKIDAEEQEIEAIKDKVEQNLDLSNKEMAKLLVRALKG